MASATVASVKHRSKGKGGESICATVDSEVKRAAQRVARTQGKSLSLWLEDVMRAELGKASHVS